MKVFPVLTIVAVGSVVALLIGWDNGLLVIPCAPGTAASTYAEPR